MIFFVLENIHGVSKYLVVHASHKIVSHNLILITHSVANYSFFILCVVSHKVVSQNQIFYVILQQCLWIIMRIFAVTLKKMYTADFYLLALLELCHVWMYLSTLQEQFSDCFKNILQPRAHSFWCAIALQI